MRPPHSALSFDAHGVTMLIFKIKIKIEIKIKIKRFQAGRLILVGHVVSCLWKVTRTLNPHPNPEPTPKHEPTYKTLKNP